MKLLMSARTLYICLTVVYVSISKASQGP